MMNDECGMMNEEVNRGLSSIVRRPAPPGVVEHHVYRGRPLRPPRFYAYVLAGQGLFKWAVRERFMISAPLARCPVAGLPLWPGRTRLVAPAIPVKWLRQVVGHARSLGRLEQMYHFHYLEEAGWRVSVPPQTATAGRVRYRGGAERSIVLDLHSHHEMAAGFSATDDADEQGCRFYGVLGDIFSASPRLVLRAGVWGDYEAVRPEVLFEENVQEVLR